MTARFFTDEEFGAKKIIAIRLEDARRRRFAASVAGDERSRVTVDATLPLAVNSTTPCALTTG